MFCTHCGNQVDDAAIVCTKCGVPVAGKKPSVKTDAIVKNHMTAAILTTIFCCQIPGIVAIVYACKVNEKIARGDIEGAQSASETANTWIICGVILGLVVSLLGIIVPIITE